jgi:FKBP-type peptidyl-prolyl cis-trans isomerase FklB
MRIVCTALIAALALSPLSALAQPGAEPPPAASAAPDGGAAGVAFLAKNKTATGVVTTATGLQYKILAKGPATGGSPTPDDLVAVNYEGKLLDGTVFDSTADRGVPAVFQLGGLVPAWVEAMQMMKPGDQWTLWAPPSLAYGERESGPIPANSVLEFKIQLIDFLSLTPPPSTPVP